MATGKLPKALENRPELRDSLEPYIQAFITLSSFRNEQGKINFSDIVLYADKICEEEVLDFVSIMSAADNAYLSAVENKKVLTESVKKSG